MEAKYVALIVALVVIVVIFFVGNYTGAAFWTKEDIARKINAHECRADGTCEVQNLEAEEFIWAHNVLVETKGGDSGGIGFSHDEDEDAQADTWFSIHNQFLNMGTNGMMSVNLKNYPNSTFPIAYQMNYLVKGAPDKKIQQVRRISGGFINTFYEEVHIDDAIVFDDLTGNGNAYACIDATGEIFRSETPCR